MVRFTANHHCATSSLHDNHSISNLHLLLALSTEAKYGHLVIVPASLCIPFFFFHNFLFPSIFTTVCTLFVSDVYAHTLWAKRGSDCDIRPVCSLRDKQWNRFCKSGSGGVVKTAVEGLKNERRLSLCYLNPPMAGISSKDFTYPLGSSSARLARAFGFLLFLPQGLCLSNYRWNVEAGPWSPHTQQHSAALSTCLRLPAQRKRHGQSHWTAQQRGNCRGEWEGEKHFISRKKNKKTYWAGCMLCALCNT